jgi:hypothetical protein
MNRHRFFAAIAGLAFVVAVSAFAAENASAAPVTVGLGTAASFSILAGTPAITNTGATTIDKDVGIHPAAAITGFPPGIVGGTIHAADAVALQAKNDLVLAYNNAAGRAPTGVIAGGALGGLKLVSGVYNAGGTTLDLTGTLTLDGQNDPNSVWIFQATSDLKTATVSAVSLINGANPCNVFWQVTSSANLLGPSFSGTILATTSITLGNGVVVQGRALAQNGDVTLINDRFITSSCSAVTVTPSPAASPAATATPATPAATPTTSAASATRAPAAPTATPVSLAGVHQLPSTSTNDPLGPLALLGAGMIGLGAVLLRRPVTRA